MTFESCTLRRVRPAEDVNAVGLGGVVQWQVLAGPGEVWQVSRDCFVLCRVCAAAATDDCLLLCLFCQVSQPLMLQRLLHRQA